MEWVEWAKQLWQKLFIINSKALYNQLLLESFKDCCFLTNVREILETLNGLKSLQQQLINNILKSKTKIEVHSVDEGTELLKARLCCRKILVVIDDVDIYTRFESLVGPFGPGSLVIITTRDKGLLDKIEVEAKYQYFLKELDETESLTLFNRHAFGNAKPDDTFMVLSRDIIQHAGGLPLALEVFGSSLYKQPVVGWKSLIEKLQRIPNSTIQQRLIISFDALDDPMLKKIFLDIACLFIGRNKEWVVQKMESYYSYVDYNIELLKNKCLLTINRDGDIRMHDLLRDMGRDIVRNNSPKEPGKHSRLFMPEDISYVLMKYKGTEAIEVIYLQEFKWQKDCLEGVSLTVESFKDMGKLRFLLLESTVNFTGSFEDTFVYLRWLYWKYCPLKHLPSRFCPQKLVILELPHSKMTTMQEPHMVPEVFENLKTLNMSYSLDLSTTPDFTNMPCLETLNLEGCESLEELHISIGSLVRLISLNLYACRKLRRLSDSICNLGALESLNIDCCRDLEALPLNMGDMKSLIELNSRNLTLLNLPDSIGHLSKLVYLRLSKNEKLETLPDTICDLRALEVLDISFCSSLKGLPTELGSIVSLKILEAEGLGVLKLPDSVGYLTKLVHLNLCGNKNLETLPDSFCNSRTLEVLYIYNCHSLKALPVEFGNVELLKVLNVDQGNISKLPDSIGRLSMVVELNLGGNENLEFLPDSICKRKSLEILDISFCENLTKLPDQLWNISGLREIDARGTTLLEKLPDIEPSQIPLSLYKLDVSESGLTALPSGISQLSKLEYLSLSGCDDLLTITELPPNLGVLFAFGCRSMERLQNLSNLPQLEILNLAYCSGLIEILALEELTSFQELGLSGCNLSSVTNTLTKTLFQQINSKSGRGSIININNSSFLGIILCFEIYGGYDTYIIKNTARHIIWTGNLSNRLNGLMIVVIPRSMLSLTDEDHTIELTVINGNASIHGFHLL